MMRAEIKPKRESIKLYLNLRAPMCRHSEPTSQPIFLCLVHTWKKLPWWNQDVVTMIYWYTDILAQWSGDWDCQALLPPPSSPGPASLWADISREGKWQLYRAQPRCLQGPLSQHTSHSRWIPALGLRTWGCRKAGTSRWLPGLALSQLEKSQVGTKTA